MKKLLLSILLASFLVSTPAFALTLDQARQQGLVGEATNGLLVLRDNNHAQARNLVNSINAERTQAFKTGASNAGVALEVFQIRAGERIRQQLPSGVWYQDANGQWHKK